MSTKVALNWNPVPEELDRIRQVLPADEVELISLSRRYGYSRFDCPPEILSNLVADADALMAWAPIPLSSVRYAKRLRFIAYLHAGCDDLDVAGLATFGIRVANARGSNGVAVAEHAAAFMLALAKRTLANDQSVREARWREWWGPEFVSSELQGATVCIIGFGNIGRPLGRICRGFDMNVLAVRRSAEASSRLDDNITIGGPEQLQAFLGVSDYVVLALPLTTETFGFVNEERLGWMKTDGNLINVARGELVDERAIYDALTSGKLSGFASDVWWDYPYSLPTGYHFPVPSRMGVHLLPNVVGSGGAAANILNVRNRMIDIGLRNVRAHLDAVDIPELVDPRSGY